VYLDWLARRFVQLFRPGSSLKRPRSLAVGPVRGVYCERQDGRVSSPSDAHQCGAATFLPGRRGEEAGQYFRCDSGLGRASAGPA
jgi:hypothetical protein